MKTLYNILALILFASSVAFAQNVEFEKSNFPDKKDLLNGASDWNQYSWGGCSLIYNSDIAERVCSPSKLKRQRIYTI